MYLAGDVCLPMSVKSKQRFCLTICEVITGRVLKLESLARTQFSPISVVWDDVGRSGTGTHAFVLFFFVFQFIKDEMISSLFWFLNWNLTKIM